MKPQIKAALPAMVKPDQFMRVALTTMRNNPDLLKCSPVSVASSLMTSAQLGLVCDSVLGQAYLIPFNSSKRGMECQLVIGYKGLLALARRSGDIADINPFCVYKGDKFSFTMGDDPSIDHEPGPNFGVSDDDITHVYVVVRFKNGGKAMSVWPRKKIEAHRDRYSKGAGRSDSPWKTSFGPMGIKSVLRAMINGGMIPVSVDVLRAVSAEEEWEARTVNGSVVSSRPSLDSLADGILGGPSQDDAEDAEIVESPAKDVGETLAEAADEIKNTETVRAADACYKKWAKVFDGEQLEHLDHVLFTHKEFLREG